MRLLCTASTSTRLLKKIDLQQICIRNVFCNTTFYIHDHMHIVNVIDLKSMYFWNKQNWVTYFWNFLDISNQNYLFGSCQKKGPSIIVRRGKKHIKVLSEKAYFIMAGGTAALLLAYFCTRILLSLFDTQPIQKLYPIQSSSSQTRRQTIDSF